MWSIVLFVALSINGELVLEMHPSAEQFASWHDCHNAIAEIVEETGEPASNQTLACVRSGQEIKA